MKRLALFTLLAVLLTAFTAKAENYILYTSTDGNVVNPTRSDVFGTRLVSNTYEDRQGKMVFDSDVTEIGARAFDGQTSLTSIEIPTTVKSIGYHAFYSCFLLPSLNIPGSVTEIDDGAFERCDLMTSITLNDSLTSIKANTFKGCKSLKSIKIPNSVKTIDVCAFQNCSALTAVLLGKSVESIGDFAFSGCDGVSELVSLNTTPPTIQALGDAFPTTVYNKCKLKVPAAAVDDYKQATYWNWFNIIGLTNNEIAEIVKNFGDSEEPVIPNEPFEPYTITVGVDISSVGWSNVNFWTWGGDGTHAPINNVWPGDRVTETQMIAGHTFYVRHYTISSPTDEVCVVFSTNNGSPQTQDITGINTDQWFSVSTVMSSGNYLVNDISDQLNETPETDYLIFEYADSTQTAWKVSGHTENLPTSIVIPAERQSLPVTSIGARAFYLCTALKSVVIGSSVTEIGEQAFQCCDLTEVTLLSTTPPNVYDNTFAEVNTAVCTLKVPAVAVSAYSSAAVWQNFGEIIPCDSVDAEKGTLDNPYTPSEAIEIVSALAAEARTEPVYVKGIVSRIKEVSPNFGNATFYISDDGTTNNEFYIYRCKGLGGANIQSADEVKLGDHVVIYGPLVNYHGNTPETVANDAYIHSINDLSGISEVTLDKRFNGKTYNLQGIEVGEDYKGIVIENGKKIHKR